jgi:hypothetical protein
MDSNEDSKTTKHTDVIADACDILQSIWIRYFVCRSNEINKFILAYGFDFLPRIGFFLFFILGLKEILEIIL